MIYSPQIYHSRLNMCACVYVCVCVCVLCVYISVKTLQWPPTEMWRKEKIQTLSTGTMCPGLPESDMVFTWCPGLAVSNAHVIQCFCLDNKDSCDIVIYKKNICLVFTQGSWATVHQTLGFLNRGSDEAVYHVNELRAPPRTAVAC